MELNLLNNSNNYGGIYRGLLIDVDGDIRACVPGLHSHLPIKSDGNTLILDVDKFKENKNLYPKIQWNVPNLQAQTHERPLHPCWITFENGEIMRPIVMGWLGDGIKYSVNNSSSTTTNVTPGDNGVKPGKLDLPEGSLSEKMKAFLNDIDWANTMTIEKGSGTGTQCPELPNYYIEEVFGIKNNGGFGNGIDYCDINYSNSLPNQYPDKFEYIDWSPGTEIRAGDIMSMTSPSTTAGHVVIIKTVNDDGSVVIIHQGASKTKKPEENLVRVETCTISGNIISKPFGSSRTINCIARPIIK